MENNNIRSTVDIAVSGIRSQGRLMKISANNIANAHTTQTSSGGPYRRKILALTEANGDLSGVLSGDIMEDVENEFKSVLMKGHPHADEDGYVQMPNVEVPTEMVSMMSASRAYQANAAVLKKHLASIDLMLELLR